jgi:hypothetical protein
VNKRRRYKAKAKRKVARRKRLTLAIWQRMTLEFRRLQRELDELTARNAHTVDAVKKQTEGSEHLARV